MLSLEVAWPPTLCAISRLPTRPYTEQPFSVSVTTEILQRPAALGAGCRAVITFAQPATSSDDIKCIGTIYAPALASAYRTSCGRAFTTTIPISCGR